MNRRHRLCHHGFSDRSATSLGSTSADTIAIGARLHVRVIEVRDLALVTNTVYGYDVALQTKSGTRQTLVGMTLMGGAVPIGHVPGERPSFMLPSPRDKLAIVHASCRKPHGGGPDMLPLVDALVGAGGIVYFGVAWLTGAIDRSKITMLTRKQNPK